MWGWCGVRFRSFDMRFMKWCNVWLRQCEVEVEVWWNMVKWCYCPPSVHQIVKLNSNEQILVMLMKPWIQHEPTGGNNHDNWFAFSWNVPARFGFSTVCDSCIERIPRRKAMVTSSRVAQHLTMEIFSGQSSWNIFFSNQKSGNVL